MNFVDSNSYLCHLRRVKVAADAVAAQPIRRTWLKRLVALLAFSSAASAYNAPVPPCKLDDMACIHKLLGYERPSVVVIYRAAKGAR